MLHTFVPARTLGFLDKLFVFFGPPVELTISATLAQIVWLTPCGSGFAISLSHCGCCCVIGGESSDKSPIWEYECLWRDHLTVHEETHVLH